MEIVHLTFKLIPCNIIVVVVVVNMMDGGEPDPNHIFNVLFMQEEWFLEILGECVFMDCKENTCPGGFWWGHNCGPGNLVPCC